MSGARSGSIVAVLLFGLALGAAAVAAPPLTPPGMVYLAGGSFEMGGASGSADEAPAHRVTLSPYFIDKREVTVKSFAAFVRLSKSYDKIEGPWYRYSARACLEIMSIYQTRYRSTLAGFRPANDARQRRALLRWRAAQAALQQMSGVTIDPSVKAARWRGQAKISALIRAQDALPVRGVSWRDAAAYARWSKRRLPTEAEWELAARPAGEGEYPWGRGYDAKRLRAGLPPEAGPAPVGSFASGSSAAGCYDMSGNVWEWVADWYGERYYQRSKGSVDPKGPAGLSGGALPTRRAKTGHLRMPSQGREEDTRKVIRGGGFAGSTSQARFNTRFRRRLWSNPSYGHADVGFRCAKDAGRR